MKMVKILKLEVTSTEINLEQFLNSNECYFEYIDLNRKYYSECYSTDERYPNENFIMVYQEFDNDLFELGYTLTGKELVKNTQYNYKNYILDNIENVVLFED